MELCRTTFKNKYMKIWNIYKQIYENILKIWNCINDIEKYGHILKLWKCIDKEQKHMEIY